MTQRERITCAVYEAVDVLNGHLPRSRRLPKAPGTPLVGPGAALDSLGLVNLIATVQERIMEALGSRLTLADGAILAGGPQSVLTLEGLIEFIETTLDARTHA